MADKIEKDTNKAQTLEDFLIANPVNLADEVKISDRIPFNFKIHAMSNEVYSSLQKRYTKMFRKGKMSFDGTGFNIGLIIECCDYPDFKDATFVKKVGVITPEDAVKKVLLPGEITNLAGFIQELSGFDKDTEELREEVKNS